MLLTLSTTPEAADGADAPAFSVSAQMPLADFLTMVDMMGSIYDEAEPKQDSDADGLLWLDAEGNTVTQAKVDEATAAPAGPGADRQRAQARFTPKYRPRTREEAWAKIAAGLTKGTIANAKRRAQELAARELPAPPAISAVAK
jgi:hypothetical protein